MVRLLGRVGSRRMDRGAFKEVPNRSLRIVATEEDRLASFASSERSVVTNGTGRSVARPNVTLSAFEVSYGEIGCSNDSFIFSEVFNRCREAVNKVSVGWRC